MFSLVRGDGTPVLFLHGLTIDHRMMLPLDVHFAHGNWARHYVDLPGHGRSSRLPHMSSSAVIDAVAGYIDEHFVNQRFVMVGASYGGFLARALHVQYTSRVVGTALLAPAVRASENRTVYQGGPVYSDGFELDPTTETLPALDAFLALNPLHTIGSYHSFRTHVVPGLLAHDADAITELQQHYDLEPYPEATYGESLTGRSLVVTGKQDSVVGWREQLDLAEFYEHQTYAAIDDAGHNVHLDQSAVTGHLITTWLSTLT